MRATLWHGSGEAGTLRCVILKDVFAAAGIPLDVVFTHEALLAAASGSRRAEDRHILIVDRGAGEPSAIGRCIAVIGQTTLPVHIIHPRAEAVHALGAATGRSPVWLPADIAVFTLLDTLLALKARGMAAPAADDAPRPTLTAREREVFRFSREGCTAIAIATRLGIAPNTVKTHLANARRKLAPPLLGAADWPAIQIAEGTNARISPLSVSHADEYGRPEHVEGWIG